MRCSRPGRASRVPAFSRASSNRSKGGPTLRRSRSHSRSSGDSFHPTGSRSMLRRPFLIAAAALAAAFALPALAANPQVEFDTTAGKIRVELFPDAAPKTVANFLDYVKAKHYDGTQFHRVIQGFMIQGGGFTPDFKQKPVKPPIAIESEQSSKAGLMNVPGTLAMARTTEPNSA